MTSRIPATCYPLREFVSPDAGVCWPSCCTLPYLTHSNVGVCSTRYPDTPFLPPQPQPPEDETLPKDETQKKRLPLQAKQAAEADWQPPRVTSLRVVSASTPTLPRFGNPRLERLVKGT